MIMLPAWAIPHMPLMLGLAAGSLAKFGLKVEKAEPIPPREIKSHCMFLPLCALLAYALCETTGAAPSLRAVIGGAAAILSAKLVERFLAASDRAAENRLAALDQDKPA